MPASKFSSVAVQNLPVIGRSFCVQSPNPFHTSNSVNKVAKRVLEGSYEQITRSDGLRPGLNEHSVVGCFANVYDQF